MGDAGPYTEAKGIYVHAINMKISSKERDV